MPIGKYNLQDLALIYEKWFRLSFRVFSPYISLIAVFLSFFSWGGGGVIMLGSMTIYFPHIMK